jgi:hypothetical protein
MPKRGAEFGHCLDGRTVFAALAHHLLTKLRHVMLTKLLSIFDAEAKSAAS